MVKKIVKYYGQSYFPYIGHAKHIITHYIRKTTPEIASMYKINTSRQSENT